MRYRLLSRRLAAAALIVFSLLSAAFAQTASTAPSRAPFDPPPYPLKTLSADQVGTMFERPTSVLQLLLNLKIAMDKDLLLQANFFTDANLLRFFNGEKVSWSQPSQSDRHARRAEIAIDHPAFPKLAVKIVDNRWQDSKYDAKTKTYVPGAKRMSGTILIEVQDMSQFAEHAVAQVFGTDLIKTPDTGESTHGAHTLTSKGSYTYELRWQPSKTPYFEKRATFHFSPDDVNAPTSTAVSTDVYTRGRPLEVTPLAAFRDDDHVKKIELYELR